MGPFVRRGTSLVCVAAVFALSLPAKSARAEPDPVLATLLSAGATLIPTIVGTTLLATGEGADEGIRFDIGLVSIGVGAILGPSVGQLYASGGGDALVVFILRGLASAIMLTGLAVHLRGKEDFRGTGTALLVVGAIPTTLLGIYDIVTAYGSAVETRRKAGHGYRTSIDPELGSIAACGALPCGAVIESFIR